LTKSYLQPPKLVGNEFRVELREDITKWLKSKGIPIWFEANFQEITGGKYIAEHDHYARIDNTYLMYTFQDRFDKVVWNGNGPFEDHRPKPRIYQGRAILYLYTDDYVMWKFKDFK
jgi:hypothetical protein